MTRLSRPISLIALLAFAHGSAAGAVLTWPERAAQAKPGDTPASTGDASGAEDARYWVITPNPKLKGPTGRIVVRYPGQASLIFHVIDGNGKQLVGWYEPSSGTFMPGTYIVRIWNGAYEGVPVKKNMDTRIKVGVLKLNIEEPYEILDAQGRPMFSGHPAEKNAIVFPVGTYTIRTSTLNEKIEIKDEQVTDF